MIIKKAFYKIMLVAVFSLTLFGASSVYSPKNAHAACCTGCFPAICPIALDIIRGYHSTGESQMKLFITNQFNKHIDWLENVFMPHIITAMMMMTEQLSAVGMHQMFVVGTLMDAKMQLETQRLFQELQIQAHKDYQPSEDFCWFGTNVRSLASSERAGRFSTMALSARQMDRHLGTANAGGASGRYNDKAFRWSQFVDVYCDPQDNNWEGDGALASTTGLTLACGTGGGGETERINRDIDYTRMIDEPRTLNVAYAANPNNPTADEIDVVALGNNLFGHDVLSREADSASLRTKARQHLYLALRSVAAKRSVAEHSYNAIVGLKASGTAGDGPVETRQFLGAIMKELGVPDAEVYQVIGAQPSYYAQLELLAKKIYQNPDFYANLYDKPANVQRKSVALKAIDLMLDRAIYESQMRQEMVMSVLYASDLNDEFRDVSRGLLSSGDR